MGFDESVENLIDLLAELSDKQLDELAESYRARRSEIDGFLAAVEIEQKRRTSESVSPVII